MEPLLLDRIEDYILNYDDFIVPIKKIYQVLLTPEERMEISLERLEHVLRLDQRFKILDLPEDTDLFGNICENDIKSLEKEMLDRGYYTGSRVWLRNHVPPKEKLLEIIKKKNQEGIDNLVKAWEVRLPEHDSEDRLLDLMREMKSLKQMLENLLDDEQA